MKIIGITGTLGAGKGEVVNYLVKTRGFVHYSVREYLNQVITQNGLESNRDNMRIIANQLRQDYGPSFIIEQLYSQASQNGKNSIIESIRCPGELEFLRNRSSFFFLGIDAKPELRYNRIHERGTSTDDITFERFLEQEMVESNNVEPFKQNLVYCLNNSDLVLFNDGTLEEFHQNIELSLKDIFS